MVHRIVRYFVKALDFVPLFIDPKGNRGRSDDYKEFKFDSEHRSPIIALLNSTLFYWYWRSHSDGFHCGYNDVYAMPYRMITNPERLKLLDGLVNELMRQLAKISEKKSIKTKGGKIQYQEFYPAKSKAKIDEIDRVLALHYGFNTEELDFVLNYDAKYRLGGEAEGEEAE